MSQTPSLGMQALLLIRLDARPVVLLSVHALAARHGMPLDQVRAALQALWDGGYARCQMGADGLICSATAALKG